MSFQAGFCGAVVHKVDEKICLVVPPGYDQALSPKTGYATLERKNSACHVPVVTGKRGQINSSVVKLEESWPIETASGAAASKSPLRDTLRVYTTIPESLDVKLNVRTTRTALLLSDRITRDGVKIFEPRAHLFPDELKLSTFVREIFLYHLVRTAERPFQHEQHILQAPSLLRHGSSPFIPPSLARDLLNGTI